MKKLLTLSLLLVSLLSYSQTMTLEGSRFYLDGKRLETREARQLLNTNYESASLYKEAKSKEAVGGFLLGFGIGLTVGDLAVGLFSDAKYPGVMTYVFKACSNSCMFLFENLSMLTSETKLLIICSEAHCANLTRFIFTPKSLKVVVTK